MFLDSRSSAIHLALGLGGYYIGLSIFPSFFLLRFTMQFSSSFYDYYTPLAIQVLPLLLFAG